MNATEWKEKFSLVEYARENFYFREISNGLMIQCPFHADKNPSCMIRHSAYKCYGCGESGDSIDFLMKSLGMSFTEVLTCTELSSHILENKIYYRKKKAVRLPSSKEIEVYSNRLQIDLRLRQWIRERHIIDDSYNLGYVENPKFFYNFSSPRIIIPVYQNGRIINARYRITPLEDSDEPKYLGHPGRAPSLFNVDVLSSDSIVIAGSELDAIALSTNGIPSVGLPGENIFLNDWIELFLGKNVLIWLDYDWAGINGAISIYKKIKDFAAKAEIFSWPTTFSFKDDIKDFIDVFGIAGAMKIYREALL